ncbi:histidinol-phosphate phosphatase family protein [Thalassoporum mexicanum PCC 7367]|uniref:D-glycero-alpha-D-manno-heptose-1,7-bisphosphate 7-phosphatase n=1 Tax=Thalassoporum mexicanum TaxID=3457544 RepID=UPI00029F80D4|nr:HAD family hydrolase [Pseudanabaena sp. PCC 7367]AFY70307.1 histidinol-phosphate phosphatase family protein [Pseudanabaena sp. PCC 7367]
MLKPAVFFDRDGVLNQEAGYIKRLEDLLLMPNAAAAVRSLNDRQIFCCMVSNQAGAARGYYPHAHIDALHKRLSKLLADRAAAHLDAMYYCPSLSQPEGGIDPELTYYSTWRKPNPGMLVAAAWEHDLDLRRSFMIGDKATDIDLAHNAGCRGVLVKSGYGESVLAGSYQHTVEPNFIASDIAEAVNWILEVGFCD